MACSSEGAINRRMNQFDKIRRMDQMVYEMTLFLEEKGIKTDFSSIGMIPEGTFNEAVDFENIHQSLEGFTNIVEHKLAYVVCENLQYLDDFKEIAYQEGEKIAYNKYEYLDRIFSYLDLNLLDGMPCDETKQIVKMTENELSWIVVEDKHEPFWKEEIRIYYEILKKYIEGILSHTKVQIRIDEDKCFRLQK